MARLLRGLVCFTLSFFLFSDSVPISEVCSYVLNSLSYEDMSNKFINWHGIFGIELEEYYVYFYSPYCGHCQTIKDKVIQYALCGSIQLFFVSPSNEVLLGMNIELTIGASSIEALWILGYPSLLKIKESTVTMNIPGATTIIELLST